MWELVRATFLVRISNCRILIESDRYYQFLGGLLAVVVSWNLETVCTMRCVPLLPARAPLMQQVLWSVCVCLSVCVSVCEITHERINRCLPNLWAWARVIKFWCCSDSVCVSRITFPLSLTIRDRAFYCLLYKAEYSGTLFFAAARYM